MWSHFLEAGFIFTELPRFISHYLMMLLCSAWLLGWFIDVLKACDTADTFVSSQPKPPGSCRGRGVDLPSMSTEGAFSLPQESERCIVAWCWALGPVGLLLNLWPWLSPPSGLPLHSSSGYCWAEVSLMDGAWNRPLGVSYCSLSRLGTWYSSLCLRDGQELNLEAGGQEVEVDELGSGVRAGGGGGVGGGIEGGEDRGAGRLATEPNSSPPPWLAVSRLPT